jgi:hypothetical protein
MTSRTLTDLATLAGLLASTPAGPDHDALAAQAQAIADRANCPCCRQFGQAHNRYPCAACDHTAA